MRPRSRNEDASLPPPTIQARFAPCASISAAICSGEAAVKVMSALLLLA